MDYKYYAFISYNRKDEKYAKWVQDKLESYKLPSRIVHDNPDLKKGIRPIFRDKTDLGTGILCESLGKEFKRYPGVDAVDVSDDNGIFGYEYEVDDIGHVLAIYYLDNTKTRSSLKNGMACIRYTYDDMGNVVREQYLDMQSKPCLTNDRGAEIRRIFDKYGNNIEESYHEAGGSLYLTPSNGYAIVRKKSMNNTKMNTSFIIERLRHYGSRSLSTAVAALFLMSVIMVNTSALHAQSTTKSPVETTIEGTLNMYLVTNYGEKMQEVDRYRETGEGSMIACILKTDKKIDMTQYLDKEGIEALKDYAGTTLQSEFMIVPDWEVFESFSYKDFAAKYANKRIRVTGTLFFPMGGWQNVTPVRMDFSKVELTE